MPEDQTGQSMIILSPIPHESFALPTRCGKRILMSWATSQWEMMQMRCLWVKRQSKRCGLDTKRDFSMWNLIGTLNIYLMNHHLKDYQPQSPLIWWRRPSPRWSLAKLLAHQIGTLNIYLMNHHLKDHQPSHQDEVWQSCWPIRCRSGDDQSSRWYMCYHDLQPRHSYIRDG